MLNEKGQLLQMINGYMVSQALRCVAELDVAGKLDSGPKTAEQLADSNIMPAALYRVMRALSSVGVFAETPAGFELTPLSNFLRRDHPESIWSAAVMMPNEFGKAFDYLPTAVSSGEDTFKKANGAVGWDYLVANPDRGAIFDEMMQALHGNETEAFIDAYDFGETKIVVDVGGGNGDVLAKLFDMHSHVKGILFDRPDVTERTASAFENTSKNERCQFIGGDFFNAIPEGGDVYLMRHIIHDWSDSEALKILKSCRAAIADTGRLLIVEGVIVPGNDPSPFKWLDLVMMLCWGGLERTEAQYSVLLKDAGFDLIRVIPTKSDVSIIECIPSVGE
ncbi:MAG: methyltransferase [Cycloclasticus sp.]|nr:MAG: methyltransferase [Cycloclasticus sp.]